MPFKEINIENEIEERCSESEEFKNLWEENRNTGKSLEDVKADLMKDSEFLIEYEKIASKSK